MFSWLAIVTSFLGVGIGLYDYFLEKLKLNGKLWFNKVKVGFVTFIPPIAVTIINKNVFVTALAFAAISLSILAVVFPSLISLRINNKDKIDNKGNNKNTKILSSRILAILTLLIGVFIIIFEILNILSF